MGVIPTGWFISKNAIEMDDLEVLPSMVKKTCQEQAESWGLQGFAKKNSAGTGHKLST